MISYNERLINSFNPNNLNKFLADSKFYEKAITENLNRFNPDSELHCSIQASLDALNNYIVKCLKEDPLKLNRNDIIKYREYLFSTFKTTPLIVLDNIFFKDDIIPLLFSTPQIKEIQNYKENLKINLQSITNRINRKEKITKEEYEKYILFLMSQIDNTHPKATALVENSIGLLLQEPTNKSLLEKEFILKYTASKVARESDIPQVQVYLSNDNLYGNELSQATNGISFGNTSIIALNRNKIVNDYKQYDKITPLIKFIQTTAHETKHSVEAYEDANGIVSYSSFEYARFDLFGKYLSKENFNEYVTNYRHSEIEKDANIFGWTFTTKLLEKFNPNLIQDIERSISEAIKTQYNEHLGNKTNGEKRTVKEHYNVTNLDRIIKEHPEELQRHKELLAVYNNDGTRKDIISLIDSESYFEQKSKDPFINNMFYEFFNFDISNGLLDTLDLSSLNKEDQYKLLGKVNEILKKEIEALSHSITILNNNNFIEFENVNLIRIKRINYLVDYFNSNQELLTELIARDIKENNRRAFGFSFDITMKKLENLQRKLQKEDILQNTTIYNELKELGEIDYSGFRL